jgi:hypothetical protein
MQKRIVLATAVLAVLSSMNVAAKEGMWVPQQLPEISGPLKQAGLKLDPKQLANLTGDPMGAVVSLGGCTASFVSPNGLVATNHHCVYGAIQLNTTKERNLIRDGLNAKTLDQELSAGENARVFVMDQITDVSDKVKANLFDAMDGLARQKTMEMNQKAIIAECEKEAGYRCSIASFYGGVQYRLFRQMEIKDVRLVYAPPSSIGNYGGEVDNWMWPRHTGDFSFYRAYVGKDGKPAAFSKDNVPYKPKHWLKVAKTPLGVNDFVMVAGYPGSTNRYAIADEFDNVAEWQYPTVGQHLKNMRDLVHKAGAGSEDVKIKYASTVRNWENNLKNWDGQLEGFKRMGAGKIKRDTENDLLAWLKSRGNKGTAALDAHGKLVNLAAQSRSTRQRDLVLGQLGIGVMGASRTLYRLSIEKEKPNAERAPGFQERDISRLEGAQKELQKRFAPSMEKQLLTYWLKEYVKLPSSQRVAALDKWLGGSDAASIQRALDNAYSKTQLGTAEKRLEWMKANKKAFEASQDPLIKLSVALMPTLLKLEDEGKVRAGEQSRYRPVYMAAVQEYKRSKGQGVYPDANGTLRITFGNVTGYPARDGVAYTPFTTAEGMAVKATGQEPFDAPKNILDAVARKDYGRYSDAKLGTLPVNFLSDLDITGGNSGSPVLNARGELVGLAFDGNWESVSSNWVYDGSLNRMISVDARYMLWVMDKIMPAPGLLKEMGQ